MNLMKRGLVDNLSERRAVPFIIFITLLLLLLAVPTTPSAQDIKPPPRQDAKTPTGVTYRNGSFSLEETDLSIGGGLPTGLSLTRSYNSSSSGISDPFVGAVGWTQSFNVNISTQIVPFIPHPELIEFVAPNEFSRCIYNLSGGPKSSGFNNVTHPPRPPIWANKPLDQWIAQIGCGFRAGSYVNVGNHDGVLEYLGDEITGSYKFTGSDGSVLNFLNTGGTDRALNWTMADGTKLDFGYANGKLRSIFSNRGWAILFESEFKICAVNTAITYVTPTSSCPVDAQTVTYGYQPGSYNSGIKLMTSVSKGGETTLYTYNSKDKLDCIKSPGQASCKIQNTYTACPENQISSGPIQPQVHLSDYVSSQTDASGRIISYSYGQPLNSCPYAPSHPDPDLRPFQDAQTTITQTGITGATVVITHPSNQIESVKVPLGPTGQKTSFGYETTQLGPDYLEHGDLLYVQQPEGNGESYEQDSRGNVTKKTVFAKPGSGLPNIVTLAAYPATCANIFTCNKPTSITDPNGKTSTFEYAPEHGGIVRETGPADASGIQPVKRSKYEQRYALIKNPVGGYSQAASSVWLKTEERTCRNSATISDACAAGSADEVVTAYDYGSTTVGPNNLLLRGIVVTANGVSLRTCYAYDRDGRKISETSPNANLPSCP
jgi:hypothetical protein